MLTHMRCPKCSYLSYEEVERCRNCGYDFALAAPPGVADAPTLDAPVLTRTWEGHVSRTPREATDLTVPDQEGSAVDLPLFEAPDGRPTPEPPPMPIPPVAPPLVVRRTVDVSRTPPPPPPAPARAARTREVAPALDFDEPFDRGIDDDLPTPREGTPVVGPSFEAENGHDDGPPQGARVLGGLVDAAVVLGLNAVVVWLTLRLLGLQPGDWARLPLAPLLGFLFLLDTSYLVTFTAASGQTLGKMTTGLRVTSATGGRVPFGHAVVRSVVLLLCAAPAGLGLLPIFLDGQGRGLHDRVAGTRVIAPR